VTTTGIPGPEERLQDALDRAYRYLAMRDRTEHEMRSHLERVGVDASAIEEAVRVLTELEYLDDARFAVRFAQDRRELDAWGAERIERRLSVLGVDREHVRAALADDSGPGGELDRALVLLRRRFPEPPSDRRGRERALGVLIRKGYESELALEALARWSHS
jgi:regulatory protein